MTLTPGRRPAAPRRQRPVHLTTGLLLVHLALFQLVHASLSSPAASGSAAALGIGSASGARTRSRSRSQAILASVPEEDRGNFVIHHLAEALNVSPDFSPETPNNRLRVRATQSIPQAKRSTFKDIQTYETFSVDLLKWTMRTFGASQLDVYNMVRRSRVLCTRKGLCFNPNDLGQMCCPF